MQIIIVIFEVVCIVGGMCILCKDIKALIKDTKE